MNRELVDRLARAMLYEGYVLYPYRPSIKNRQRWTFGGLYPKAYSELQNGTDAWSLRAQVLIARGAQAKVHVAVRCLHLLDRRVVSDDAPAGATAPANTSSDAWQEAAERDIDLGDFDLAALAAKPETRTFAFPAQELRESRPASEGGGTILRDQRAIEGSAEVSCELVGPDLQRLTVRIFNCTPLDEAVRASRDDALMASLVSTHLVMNISGGGEFVSLTDPPAEWAEQARACSNAGVWPVLVGEAGERDTMLASPIILPDYPQLAPESPGDLFDSTEIDEILTLRIMTLTDEEKKAAVGLDERVKGLMARTESLAREQLAGLHGTIRGMKAVKPPDGSS